MSIDVTYNHKVTPLVTVPYDDEKDLENLLAICPINVRFLGSDYEGKHYTGKELNEKHKLYDIEYIPRYHNFSSSELRNRIHKAENMKQGVKYD